MKLHALSDLFGGPALSVHTSRLVRFQHPPPKVRWCPNLNRPRQSSGTPHDVAFVHDDLVRASGLEAPAPEHPRPFVRAYDRGAGERPSRLSLHARACGWRYFDEEGMQQRPVSLTSRVNISEIQEDQDGSDAMLNEWLISRLGREPDEDDVADRASDG